MSRLSKSLAFVLLILFLLACNLVTEPLGDVQDLAKTAQSVTTLIPIETLQALPSAIPVETLQALPSAIPTLEGFATALPNFGEIFDPQGTPVQEWQGIPIMPQATAGQDFSDDNTYSFRAAATVQEVGQFYNEQLSALGWSQPLSIPLQTEGGILFFQKDDATLTITVTSSAGSVVVVLTMA